MSTHLPTIFFNKTFKYQFIIILVSLISAHFLILQNAPEAWHELLVTAFYYYSLFTSAPIAYALIIYVFLVTRRLDREADTLLFTKLRIIKQLYLGVGGAIVLELFLAGILFAFNGQNILTNGFIDKLFPAIVLFIILINVCCCFYFFYVRQKDVTNKVVVVETIKTEVRYKFIEPKEMPLHVDEKGLPYLVYLYNKVPIAYGANGLGMAWDSNISESMEIFSKEAYFQINKQIIIHMDIIKNLRSHKEQHVLIEPIFTIPIQLVSSRRRTTPFKEWLSHLGMEVPKKNDDENI